MLTESLRATSGHASLARWYYHLQSLARRGWLVISVGGRQERLATLTPISSSFVFAPRASVSDRRYVFSRFATMRRDGEALVLESPLAFSRLVLHDARATGLVHALARPTRAGELAGRVHGLNGDSAVQLLGLFAAAGMVAEVGDDGATAEDVDPALRCWEFHDLLFHARSRVGRHNAPVGGTYRHAGKLHQPPALKPATATASETIELFRPDLERLKRNDPPFADLQERRCSIREYADEPITERQLGEFLFRGGRVTGRREWEVTTPGGTVRVESTRRPYPSGGGLYELEIYVVVNICGGLEAGLYHYDPQGHRLGRLAGRTHDVEALLSDAAGSAGMAPESLQVLLILASRFPRLAWKYASVAYSLTLKHVGVVFETMYLAATAMRLGPCALGGGDSDAFARAAGVDYYTETSVGEFLLGTPR